MSHGVGPDIGSVVTTTGTASTTTFDELQFQVYSVLRDPSKQFVKDEMVENWLNEAQRDLAVRLRILQGKRTEADSAISSNLIALPSDFIEVQTLEVDEDRLTVVPDDIYESWDDGSGHEPELAIARIWNGNLEIYPTPTAGTDYILRYYRLPTKMVNPNDRPELPGEMDARLVNYARAHGKWQMGEEGQGDRYMLMYEQGLPSANPSRQRVASDFRIVRTPTYWDEEGTH